MADIRVNVYSDEDGEIIGVGASEHEDKIDGYSVFEPWRGVTVPASLIERQRAMWAEAKYIAAALTEAVESEARSLGGSDVERASLRLAVERGLLVPRPAELLDDFVSRSLIERRREELDSENYDAEDVLLRRGACRHVRRYGESSGHPLTRYRDGEHVKVPGMDLCAICGLYVGSD
jgi:hypothetical protein